MGRTELTSRGTDEEKLTDKERRFVMEYVISYDGAKAARAAGYSAPGVSAAQLLKRRKVMRAIGKREYEMSQKLELKLEDILTQLYYCVTRTADDFCDENGKLVTDVNLLNERAKATIDGIEQTCHIDAEGNQTIKTKLKLVPKAVSIDMAMKHKGAYAPVTVEDVTKPKLDWDSITGRDEAPDPIEQRLLEEGKDTP